MAQALTDTAQAMSFSEALLTSAEAIGRLFLVALVGFIFARKQWLSKEALSGLTRLTIDIVVPCALATSMLKGFSAEVFTEAAPIMLVLVVAISLSAVTALLLYRLMPGRVRPSQDAAASALAAVPNSFYIPFPLVVAMVPEHLRVHALVLVGVAVVSVNPLQWTMGTFLVTAGAHDAEARDWKKSLRHVANGPVIGIVGGALLALFPPFVAAAREQPGSIMPLRLLFGSMSLAGQAMAPLAMIILGALIAECRLRSSVSLRLLAPVFLLRFLVVPGIVYWLISIGEIPVAGVTAFVLLLECASPPATNLAIVARRFHGEWETASGVLLVTNVASLFILPVWMALGLALK
jgi:predicted permease